MNPDALQRTLDAIDAITTCGWCGATLTADSPSPNYCCESHQELWLARNVRCDHPHGEDVEPLPEDILQALLAADCISAELAEAHRLWHERGPLNDPMPFSTLLDEFFLLRPPGGGTAAPPDPRDRPWLQLAAAAARPGRRAPQHQHRLSPLLERPVSTSCRALRHAPEAVNGSPAP
jgi:hypothetical protein